MVIATYNRPQVLRAAISSVLAQTEPRWRLLIIGDHCKPRTAWVVNGFADPRIRYINLRQRFGEQSGPNSVGMRLADTPWIALLNHDDLWLPDHLQRALSLLQVRGADFYLSRSVAGDLPDPAGRPRFHTVAARGRRLRDAFAHSNRLFEPASSFVFSAEAAARLGDWPSALDSYRVPIHAWLLRLWRSRLKVVFDEEITLIRGTAYPAKTARRGVYHTPSRQHGPFADLIRVHTAGQIRAMIDTDAPDAIERADERLLNQLRIPRRRRIARMFLNPLTAAWFYLTGRDAFAPFSRWLGQERGHRMRAASLARVGRDAIARHDLDSLVATLEQP